MSQKAFISDADAALANLIWNGIENEPATKNIISSQEQISFCSPKAAGTKGTRKLSIFLYNITEEPAARNVPPTVDYSRKRQLNQLLPCAILLRHLLETTKTTIYYLKK